MKEIQFPKAGGPQSVGQSTNYVKNNSAARTVKFDMADALKRLKGSFSNSLQPQMGKPAHVVISPELCEKYGFEPEKYKPVTPESHDTLMAQIKEEPKGAVDVASDRFLEKEEQPEFA